MMRNRSRGTDRPWLRAFWVLAWVVAVPGLTGIGLADSLRRGDANGDGGVDISDPVGTLNVLFGGSDPLACDDAADSNDDGAVNIADPVYTLNFLFGGGEPPAPPWPDCGDDPTADALSCDSYPECPPAVVCTPRADVEAEVEALAPQTTCVPPDSAGYEVAGLAVSVCPAREAGPCGGDGAEPGCGVEIDSIDASIDPVAEEATLHVEGGARELPVSVTSIFGTTVCSAELPFAADVTVPFTTAPRGADAVEIVSLGEPVLENVDVSLTVDGGAVCQLLEGAADQVLEELVAQVEASLTEFLLQAEDSLLGRVICLE